MDEKNEQQEKELAYKQVREFMKVLENDHGIKIDTVKDALRYYQSMSKWSEYLAKSIVGSVVLALVGWALYVFAEGIKAALKTLGAGS